MGPTYTDVIILSGFLSLISIVPVVLTVVLELPLVKFSLYFVTIALSLLISLGAITSVLILSDSVFLLEVQTLTLASPKILAPY